jgi:hypothetical protein
VTLAVITIGQIVVSDAARSFLRQRKDYRQYYYHQ